jgi:hypothetical protein
VYIRKTAKSHRGKSYTNYLLVESVHTPKGPRQRIICSLGSLAPAPPQEWLDLAHRLEASLQGQSSITPAHPQVTALAETARRGPRRKAAPAPSLGGKLEVDPDRVTMQEAREAGSVHVGHQVWQRLGLNDILASAGLSEHACQLSEAMTLNRLVFLFPSTPCRIGCGARRLWKYSTAINSALEQLPWIWPVLPTPTMRTT